MKEVFHKISSILMALLVLFSTMSFTVQKHICAGEVADVAIIGDLERCEMPDVNNRSSDKSNIEKESCCKDEISFVQGSNFDLSTSKQLQGQTLEFVALFIYTYHDLFDTLDKDLNSFLTYSPPIVIKDRQVLYDTFLI